MVSTVVHSVAKPPVPKSPLFFLYFYCYHYYYYCYKNAVFFSLSRICRRRPFGNLHRGLFDIASSSSCQRNAMAPIRPYYVNGTDTTHKFKENDSSAKSIVFLGVLKTRASVTLLQM